MSKLENAMFAIAIWSAALLTTCIILVLVSELAATWSCHSRLFEHFFDTPGWCVAMEKR